MGYESVLTENITVFGYEVGVVSFCGGSSNEKVMKMLTGPAEKIEYHWIFRLCHGECVEKLLIEGLYCDAIQYVVGGGG